MNSCASALISFFCFFSVRLFYNISDPVQELHATYALLRQCAETAMCFFEKVVQIIETKGADVYIFRVLYFLAVHLVFTLLHL